VLLAALLAWATWLNSSASDDWQAASTETVKWSAGVLEDARFVYADEAPTAFDVARLEVRADVLEALRTPAGSLVAVEAASARKTAGELARAASGNTLLKGGYRLGDRGYDVQRRLGDALRGDRLDHGVAAALRTEGDRHFRNSLLAAWATLPVLLGFLVARLVMAFRRRSRHTAEDVGLVPDPWTTRRNRIPNALALFAWGGAVVLAALQLSVSGLAARDGADALTRATEVSTVALGGQLFSSLHDSAIRGPAVVAMSALSRQFVNVSVDDAAQQSLGEAEEAAAARWSTVAAQMGRQPTAEDGFDDVTRRVLTAGPDDWRAALDGQQRAADQAAREGDAANLCGLALLLSVLGATSAAVARVASRRKTLVVVLSALFLILATALAISAGVNAVG
jgi:hypothetical protein